MIDHAHNLIPTHAEKNSKVRRLKIHDRDAYNQMRSRNPIDGSLIGRKYMHTIHLCSELTCARGAGGDVIGSRRAICPSISRIWSLIARSMHDTCC